MVESKSKGDCMNDDLLEKMSDEEEDDEMEQDDQNENGDGSYSSESCSEDDEDDDDSSEDDSSLGSENSMNVEAHRLWDALQPHPPPPPPPEQAAAVAPPPARTCAQVWRETLAAIQDSKTTALKLDDGLVSFLLEGGEYRDDSTLRTRAISQLISDLLAAIASCQEIRHVILGTTLLQLINSSETQQTQLYQALISQHSRTITYWKLGSDDSTELCGIPTTELLDAMNAVDWPSLTEFQVRGLALTDRSQVDGIVSLLQKAAPTIKLFNWFGLVLSPPLLTTTPGLFDPLWVAVEPILTLDEVQLQTISVNGEASIITIPPLVSHSVLEHLLQVKPKWWRMSLDGCGLDDRHLEIIGHALTNSKDCKMNDLLSIRDNPNITSKALSQFYHVCLNKQRMGLVLSDDPSWEATFDLVRPLNNLHRRLEYKTEDKHLPGVHYSFQDVDRWLEWFQVLSNLPWIDETRKLNYIWFTLVEQPEMIPTAILQLSGSSSGSGREPSSTSSTTTTTAM